MYISLTIKMHPRSPENITGFCPSIFSPIHFREDKEDGRKAK
jgi:hypothetical protein